MNNFEIKPFYVGQEIIAVCNHPQGIFKKGDEFKVVSIGQCSCGAWEISVGIIATSTMCCIICKTDKPNKIGDLRMFLASRFRPKIQLSEFVSMKEVVQLETVGAN